MEHIAKILELSAKRIDYFVSVENVKDWYKGSKTYFEGIITETTEAEWENREQNHIFLEDELWDIFLEFFLPFIIIGTRMKNFLSWGCFWEKLSKIFWANIAKWYK